MMGQMDLSGLTDHGLSGAIGREAAAPRPAPPRLRAAIIVSGIRPGSSSRTVWRR